MKAKGKQKRVRRVKVQPPPQKISLKCELCGKAFKNLAGVKGHLAVKHGEKKPRKPLIRDRFALIEHRLSSLEGRANSLDYARMQQPLGPGTPNIDELARALGHWCGDAQVVIHSPDREAFRDALRAFLMMR
jgi:hypothetical protein